MIKLDGGPRLKRLFLIVQHATIYIMIKSFKHKGLKLFFEKGDYSNIQAKDRKKLRLQLSALDTATIIEDMNLPNYVLHKLKGNRKNCWSITVSKNWRMTFEFIDGNAYVVDYEDYH